MLRLFACAVVLTARSTIAVADPRCVQLLGWKSGDCPAEVERAPDRAESAFWRHRDTRPAPSRLTGPIVPGIGPAGLMFAPAPGGQGREGSLSLDDLQLGPDGHGGYRGRRPGYH